MFTLPALTIIAGIIAIMIEVLVLSFSMFVFFFIGLGAIISGLLMYGGVVPENLGMAVLSTAIVASILLALGLKPLKKMLHFSSTPGGDAAGDFGKDLKILLEEDTGPVTGPDYSYSGVNWRLRSDVRIEKGTVVRVIRTSVGTLWVAPAETD